MLGTDHSLYQSVWNGENWSAYSNLGTQFGWEMDPIVISRETENYDIFLVQRASGAIDHKHYDGSVWSDINLGGEALQPPAVTSREEATIDIFIIDGNHQMQHNSFFANTWSGYQDLSTDSQATYVFQDLQPAAVSAASNHLQVFAIGPDSALMSRRWTSTTGWGNWNNLSPGGVFTSGPTAVSKDANQIDVFLLGYDSALYQLSSSDAGLTWDPLTKHSGTWAHRPAVVSRGPGLMDVFLVGLNSELFTYRYDGEWDPLQAFSGNSVVNAPSAVAWSTGRLHLFMVGGDSGIYYTSSPGDGTWSPSLSQQATFLGGVVVTRVGASQ